MFLFFLVKYFWWQDLKIKDVSYNLLFFYLNFSQKTLHYRCLSIYFIYYLYRSYENRYF
ncbi:MAG: hypothetical protein ACD_78C00388G0004 [uncultured bacterium (gcode 4)]|uniref:Uncharacterized protein n=1 Tax=uncultured bacterium (gcode 4) TaxID=1234023 RepID=K1YW34_9BACT|nr:MAG: hypothetical protein ACD_78C00388G0004 [uncultured bacterium (gcode 4)]